MKRSIVCLTLLASYVITKLFIWKTKSNLLQATFHFLTFLLPIVVFGLLSQWNYVIRARSWLAKFRTSTNYIHMIFVHKLLFLPQCVCDNLMSLNSKTSKMIKTALMSSISQITKFFCISCIITDFRGVINKSFSSYHVKGRQLKLVNLSLLCLVFQKALFYGVPSGSKLSV